MRGRWGWFLAPHTLPNVHASPWLVPLVLKKTKMCKKCSRNTFPFGTNAVPFVTTLLQAQNLFVCSFFFFFFTFSSFLFWACNFECEWAEKVFWHICLRYNCMYACLFKLIRTRSVNTSIGDNFLVCDPIWMHDALF